MHSSHIPGAVRADGEGGVGGGWMEAYGSHCKLPVNTDGNDRNQIFVNFSTHTHYHFANNQSKGPCSYFFPLSHFSFCSVFRKLKVRYFFHTDFSLPTFSLQLFLMLLPLRVFRSYLVCSLGCGHGQEVCAVSRRATLKSKQDMCRIPRDPQERLQSRGLHPAAC